MPQASIYNEQGQRVGEMTLADAIFQTPSDPAFIHEIMVAERANARRAIANTKTRGEVRGGGKKPWRQKGTGRARQGSIRSPQWVGGGIVFGPTSGRDYSVKVNRKAKRKALFATLTDKLANEKLFVLEQITTTEPKTKHAASVLGRLPVDRTVLLVASSSNPSLMRMVRNLQNVKLVTANSLNVLDALTYRTVIFLQDAVPVFQGLYQAQA